uniref:DUF4283 domain-containing protein n=1 Tax=Chenopodium quinoa TaxID=63459 RepID=A0A803MXG6_CHEQI
MEESTAQLKLSLVGKLCTIKPYNSEALKRTLQSIWKLKEGVAIRFVDTNLFVLQFFCEGDKDRVIEESPWFFDDKILLMKQLQGDEHPSKIVFTHTPMWVRLLDMSFNKRNAATMYDVGELLGGFVKLDEDDPLGLSEFVRMKILVDIRKPLRRGLMLATSLPLQSGLT